MLYTGSLKVQLVSFFFFLIDFILVLLCFICSVLVHNRNDRVLDSPIELKTHPFQQTSQPEGLHFGTFTSALFIGMTFVLVPVSLAVDMVYDREVII